MLMWRIWWAPNNASKWQVGFNSAFKGLNYTMNIQFPSYHWKYYPELDPKSMLFGYRNFPSDNEQYVNCLSVRRIQYDCETFN